MTDLWAELITIAIATAITPGRILALILLFHTPRAVLTSLSFVGGMISNMLIEGLAFALIFSLTGVFDADGTGGPPTIVAVLLMVMGILMLVAAAKVIFKADDDKAPPQWLAEIESFSPGKAYKLGLGWLFVSPKQWMFTLTAVGIIFSANLEPVASLVTYLLYILIALSIFFLLILSYVLLGDRSQSLMDRLFAWLKKHAETILIIVLVVFGVYFLVSGINGMAAS